MKTLRDASRDLYTQAEETATVTEIQTGAIQRIADAVELMAKRYNDLISEKQAAEGNRDYWRKRAEKLERRINAYKGTVTRMKGKGVSRG